MPRSLALCLVFAFAACSEEHDAPDVPLPFAVKGDRLAVWDGSEHRPLFVKGMNLGVAVPGTLAGELAATREQYDRWLEQIGAAGFNSIRVYTLHYPRFFDAVAHYNQRHASAPIYVLQGVWLDEENPSQDLYDMTDQFDDNIREVVDCVHGRRSIAERRGRAHGSFKSDISRWVLGYIIGREVYPTEITVTNQKHAADTSYKGESISLPSGSPSEVWFARHLDTLVSYERARYGSERPVSVSSWPTLDPLAHPSESRLSSEDSESLDLENIDTTNAPGGYFASYHAYPYYPDFMTRDPEYLSAVDREGPSSYYGYLLALKAHYRRHPLLIAEFGVPTSWGNAHFGADGMDHGGQDEREQGHDAARMLDSMLDANCAGGAFFAWIDEWWKRTWIVDALAFPRDRYPLWHNLSSPEQNFGLIAFDAPAPAFERWPAERGDAGLRELGVDLDHEFLHVRLQLSEAGVDGQTLTVGFDTYRDDAGESRLPGDLASAHRDEFALVWSPPAAPQLYVTPAYDLFGIWHRMSAGSQLYRSVASDAGEWVPVRWLNNTREEGESVEREIDEVGKLDVGGPELASDKRYGLIVDGSTLHLRLPWTLLQFSDPSTGTVIDDDRATAGTETAVSEGVAISAWLGDERLATGRLRWNGWNGVPSTVERTKASLQIFSEGVRALP
jgi:hypothetical protein